MHKKLIEQIDNIESFFKENNLEEKLNVSEEILFTTIQLIDVRGDSIVTGVMIERLMGLTGLSIDRFDEFSLDYLAKTGAFIGGLMEMFSGVMMGNPKDVQKAVGKIASHLAMKLPLDSKKETIERLLRDFIKKIEMFSKEEVLKDETMLYEISAQFTEENLNEILKFEATQNIAMMLGIITALVPLIAMSQGESFEEEEWDLDDEFSDFKSMENMLKEKMNEGALLYDEDELAYTMGKKPICNLCDKEYTPQGIKRHLNGCIEKYYKEGKEALSYLIIKDRYDSTFYLHIVIRNSASLEDLDEYLREVWLECCGHMSTFMDKREEISVDTKIGSLFKTSKKLDYIYDFGSSTELTVEFVKSFKGKQTLNIKTLTRNPSIRRNCDVCKKQKVVAVCSQCIGNEDEAYFCTKCMKNHECGIDMMLPFVNSPRLGVCGYGSWEDCDGLTFHEIQEIVKEVL